MKQFIIRFWQGKITLWKSYWLVGELLNAFLILLILNFEIYIFKNNQFSNSLPFINFNDFNFISKFLLIMWSIFISIGIWRSAENYKGNLFWIILTFLFLSYRIFNLRLIFFG